MLLILVLVPACVPHLSFLSLLRFPNFVSFFYPPFILIGPQVFLHAASSEMYTYLYLMLLFTDVSALSFAPHKAVNNN